MIYTEELIAQLNEGKQKERLFDIYVDEDCLQYQIKRYCKALQCYEEHFGKDEVAIYSAPGRSELGGNHTDHQQGKVLAAAIHHLNICKIYILIAMCNIKIYRLHWRLAILF